MHLKSLVDIPKEELAGKRVLVRSDFNVPLGKNAIVDSEEAWRIEKGLRTITYLREHGARVVVVSHLGRGGESLKPVAAYINQQLDFDMGFVPALTGDLVHDMVSELPHGGALLLENTRQHPGEEENDASFAEELSTYADLYVNDAFSASHREHASIVGLPGLLPAYAGLQFVDEYTYLSEARNPERPAMLILAGAKFGTKLALLEGFLDKVDYVFVGGALANNFFKAMGRSVGQSLVDNEANIRSLVGREEIMLPVDVTVQNTNDQTRIIDPLTQTIADDETIVDCGPATVEQLAARAADMQAIIWNGPLGNYEIGFDSNTRELARRLAGASSKVYTGGGDTVTVLRMEHITDQYTFVSTAGGAMLDFLVDGDLPGLTLLLR